MARRTSRVTATNRCSACGTVLGMFRRNTIIERFVALLKSGLQPQGEAP